MDKNLKDLKKICGQDGVHLVLKRKFLFSRNFCFAKNFLFSRKFSRKSRLFFAKFFVFAKISRKLCTFFAQTKIFAKTTNNLIFSQHFFVFAKIALFFAKTKNADFRENLHFNPRDITQTWVTGIWQRVLWRPQSVPVDGSLVRGRKDVPPDKARAARCSYFWRGLSSPVGSRLLPAGPAQSPTAGHTNCGTSIIHIERTSVAEPDPQGVASFGRSRSRNAMRLQLRLRLRRLLIRQWCLSWLGI
jgi:hypothetical protein